jgi:hypothetical protein
MATARKAVLLNALIDGLEKNRAANVLLAIAYVAFILLGHDHFVRMSIEVMNALTLPVYNVVVGSITATVGLGFVGFLLLRLRQNGHDRARQLSYLSAIVLALVLHHFLLFEMNIEVIHAALYAGLAVVLFPFTRRPGATLILSLPIMMLDEWYQYRVLYPHYVQYFDFNDILMDMLGGALALCGMWILGVRMGFNGNDWLRRDLLMLGGLVAACIAMLLSRVVVPFPQDATDYTLLVLNTLPDPHLFWRVHAYTGRVYHAMPPFEGLAVMALAALALLRMGTPAKKSDNGAVATFDA